MSEPKPIAFMRNDSPIADTVRARVNDAVEEVWDLMRDDLMAWPRLRNLIEEAMHFGWLAGYTDGYTDGRRRW